MIPATNNRDRAQLKAHALKFLEEDNYEGLVILIEELQDTGFELPEDFNKSNALRWASGTRHLEIVKYLVKQGADVHAGDNWALRWASECGHLEIVKYLVDQGADIHACKDHALRWASLEGHLEIVKYLVEQGADVRARDNCALHWATEEGHTEIAGYLQEVLKNDSSNNS